ncbi:MAG: hypothetical protein M3P30_10630 [Chloroflexota bacterium]|nr:hypothetical protein [Chloroflexota bacterium]
MGDTANWEFAAAVAAIAIGLGGLLIITIIGVIGSWRVYDSARAAAIESEKASLLAQEAARPRAAPEVPPALPPASGEFDGALRSLSELRAQADALMDQQRRLHEAVRNLVEAGVLRSEGPGQDVTEIHAAIERIEEHLSQIAAAVVNLSA